MRYVGLDVHKRIVEVAIVDGTGKVVQRLQVPTTREALTAFAEAHLQPTDRVALEATTNCWAVVDLIEPHVREVVVSNPMRTRAIAEAKVKTDKVDALVLAQLLRCNYLPRVWQPDQQTRRLRDLATHRATLVADRTRLKNRLHSLLHQRLIHPPVANLFSPRGRAWLEQLELDPQGRQTLERYLRLLAQVETELQALEKEIAQLAYRLPEVRLLMTLPGANVTVAVGLLAALGSVERFPSASKAASYLGLVPSVKQSGDHCYRGRITKQGRSHARWLLVQAAQHLATHPGPLGVFFRRLLKRKNRNVAVVATARKLVVIAWHMLRSGQPYRYALPRPTQDKLARLRVLATGRRRRGGLPKGSPRPAAYGSGQGTRKIPALQEVYASEGLPALQALPTGERRTLRLTHTLRFLRDISTPQRAPRRSRLSNPKASKVERGKST